MSEDAYATVELSKKDVCDIGFALGYICGKEIGSKGLPEHDSFKEIGDTLRRIAGKIEYLMPTDSDE